MYLPIVRLMASDNLGAGWLGTHAFPSRLYPSIHKQRYDPTSLTQNWVLVQLLSSLTSHSLMSVEKKEKPFISNFEVPESKAITNYWKENETWNILPHNIY